MNFAKFMAKKGKFQNSDENRSGAPNEIIVQNHLNIALLKVF